MRERQRERVEREREREGGGRCAPRKDVITNGGTARVTECGLGDKDVLAAQHSALGTYSKVLGAVQATEHLRKSLDDRRVSDKICEPVIINSYQCSKVVSALKATDR